MTLLLCLAAFVVTVAAAVRDLVLDNRRLAKMAMEVKARKS